MKPAGTLRVTWQALTARRRPLALLAGWSLPEMLPALLSGYLTARAVDSGFLAGRPGVGFAWLGALALAVLLGTAATGRTYRHLGAIVEHFRDDLADRVVRSALHDATRTGYRADNAAVARLTHQVEIVRDTFAGLVLVVRDFLFATVAALLGLAALAPVVAGLVAVPLVAGVLVFALALPTMAAYQRRYVRAGEELGDSAGSTLAGHRDVLACRAQERVVTDVRDRVSAQATAERAMARATALRGLSLGLGGWLPLVVLLLAAPWLARRGLTAGALLGALVYVSTGLQPALHALVQGIGGGGMRYVVTLARILETSPQHSGPQHSGAAQPAGATRPAPTAADPDDSGPSRPTRPGRAPADVPAAVTGPEHGPDVPPAVRTRGLTFRYGPAARPVLDDFDLSLDSGTHLAVVGPSGTGKSTLAALIAGLLRPQAGTVHLAGVPVAESDPRLLADLRVLVPQQAYVFTGTLADNLRYLRPEADEATLRDALDRLGAGALADRLGGLSAEISPALLSAGERQLVAATRAWLAPAPLVILDEATCHLDPAAEATVERAFADRGGTLVVIAHRISSALRAEQVLVFDGARPLVDTHERLLHRSPAYRELVGYWDDDPTPRGAAGRDDVAAPRSPEPGSASSPPAYPPTETTVGGGGPVPAQGAPAG